MPETATGESSEHARASVPNVIKATFQMSKAADQAYESEIEDEYEKPVVRTTPTKSAFGEIIAQARGGHDAVTQHKKKRVKVMKDEYERLHAQADTLQSIMPTDLHNLTGLSRARKVLQEDNDPQDARRPLGPKDANELSALISMKKRNHQINQTEVSLCDYKNFIINWDPDDPGNHNGSFIARIVGSEETSQTVKSRRKYVDVNVMTKEVAAKIVGKFIRDEDERVPGHGRRCKSIEPRRPPPKSRVLREVHDMYSQLFRVKHDKLVESKEALRANLDAGERRKALAEKTLLQAQQSRHRSGNARRLNSYQPEGGDKLAPAPHSSLSKKKKKKKTPREIAEIKVARNRERRGLSQIARIHAEPINRFRPTTVDEQNARVAEVVKQVRRERAVKTRDNPPATRLSRKSKQFTVSTDTIEDKETASPSRVTKTTRRPARRIPDTDDDSSDDEVIKKPKATMKSKSLHMSNVDRVLLAGIAQEEQRESEQYTQEMTSDPKPTLRKDEKEAAFLAEIAAIKRTQIAAKMHKSTEEADDVTSKTKRKRKATPHPDELEQSSPKKSRNQHKSAATIEDSDEEADFALHEARLALPFEEVSRGFTATADELIEQVQQQQEEKGGRRETAIEKGEEVVLDESITTIANKTIKEHGEMAELEATAVQVETLAETIEHTAAIGDEFGGSENPILDAIPPHRLRSSSRRHRRLHMQFRIL